MPEIGIICSGQVFILNSISVGQFKKYTGLMEKNSSVRVKDAMFFNKKIVQYIFGNGISMKSLGDCDTVDFLETVKTLHYIMQGIVMEKMLEIVEVETVKKEQSAFDEYDLENGYEEAEQEENPWKTCGGIIDRVVRTAIRLLHNSYTQCMEEDAVSFFEYMKFELDTLSESQ